MDSRRFLIILVLLILVGVGVWYYVKEDRDRNDNKTKKSLKEYCEEAISMGRQKQYAKAIKIMKEAEKEYPDEEAVHWNLAFMYHWVGEYHNSLEYIEKCREARPDKSSYCVFHASMIIKTSQDKNQAWRDAMAEIAGLPESERQTVGFFYNMACLYAENGRPLEALGNLEKAVALDPAESKRQARKDKDFDSIRHLPQFQQLIR